MRDICRFLWAKCQLNIQTRCRTWQPLILHLLDAAVCGEAILLREPTATRLAMSEIFGLEWEEAIKWLRLILACHDLGKATPDFQLRNPCKKYLPNGKWVEFQNPCRKRLLENGLRAYSKDKPEHALAGQVIMEKLLNRGLPGHSAPDKSLGRFFNEIAACIGRHHGAVQELCRVNRFPDSRLWPEVADELFQTLWNLFKPGQLPPGRQLSGRGFVLLAGLISFSDWIASDETRFTYGQPEDLDCLEDWLSERRRVAERTLDEIGWNRRESLIQTQPNFEEVFAKKPRPLQTIAERALSGLTEPPVVVVEAPMGEGKTEAAFYAHLVLQRRFGHRGLYLAMPSRATGNAMFGRLEEFLGDFAGTRHIDMQLLHGAAFLSEEFQRLRLAGAAIGDDHQSDGEGEGEGGVEAGEWFTHKKRALLSEYGVGTIDQALLGILPVKHHFVRLWGLANRTVILDEVHAYDFYTSELILQLIVWLRSLGSSVIVLSATLQPEFTKKLACKLELTPTDNGDSPYPRLRIYEGGREKTYGFAPAGELRRAVELVKIASDIESIGKGLEERWPGRGHVLALVNTVDRAQEMYRWFPSGEKIREDETVAGKRLSDGREIYLFHARFPADERQIRENLALRLFGKESDHSRPRLLIATQVAEQSLDLDFDLMASDLCPMDLLLQRLGRLWRRPAFRPLERALFLVAGLAGDKPPDFGKPLWWKALYREDILLITWHLLSARGGLVLPDDIDRLVRQAYDAAARGDCPGIPQDELLRIRKAEDQEFGEALASKTLARTAAIPPPGDFLKLAEGGKISEDPDLIEDPDSYSGVKTRLGRESVLAIPFSPEETFEPTRIPSEGKAISWIRRALVVSHPSLVKVLTSSGVPPGWKKSPLLRHAHPLRFDSAGYWEDDPGIRLDPELGLRYGINRNE
ncbi:MAG: CRISPR-associated helicase Cas3' [Planctomycetota bacterium]|jgi:CRISPR-associated endonuclease/helicase Cas3|nr:CRISPR-associated helicase Cas3' [Planctomycetota bacterium]